MPNNLTPEQLLALQQHYGGNTSGYVPDYVLDMGNGATLQAYDPNNLQGGFLGYETGKTKPGDTFQSYGGEGSYITDKQFRDMSGLDPLLLAALLAGTGMAAFLPGGFAAAGAGAGGGVSGAAFGDAGLMYGGADAAAAGSLGSGAAGGAGASALAGGSGALGTMAPMELMSTAGLESLTPMATGSGLTSLLSGAGKWLGPAAVLAGAAAGSQGTKGSQTTEKKMDPRLDPYWFGDSGLLAQGMGLLNEQLPINKKNSALLNSVAGGLLSQPTAGNGFSRFFGGR